MAGILLVTWRSKRREVDAEQVRRGVLYGVGAMFLMAVGIVMVKDILETRSFLWTTEIRLAGGLAGMAAYIFILLAAPEITDQACAKASIWHSSLREDPSGEPSS